jgi:hypothetical protein
MLSPEKTPEPEFKTRVSNASTNDYDFSSDDDVPFKGESIFSLDDVSKLFDKMSMGLEDTYQDLVMNLEVLYQKLDEEIQPVNVRDELSIPAGKVNLNCVARSNLCRRRSTLKQ